MDEKWKKGLSDLHNNLLGLIRSKEPFAMQYFESVSYNLGHDAASGRGLFTYNLLDEYERLGLIKQQGVCNG